MSSDGDDDGCSTMSYDPCHCCVSYVKCVMIHYGVCHLIVHVRLPKATSRVFWAFVEDDICNRDVLSCEEPWKKRNENRTKSQ